MNYIVFDLEWNQSPEGKDSSVEGFPFEIIEIGAVKLDQELNQVGSFHQLVRPQIYQKLHYKILEVTHMELSVLKKEGCLFPEAAQAFLNWCGEGGDYIFCTWGSMDLTELQRNMEFFGMEIPFAKPLLYYDVQKLYRLLSGEGKTVLSLDQAVEEMGIQEEKPFHQAFDDAYYTGKIMKSIDFVRVKVFLSMDYYRLPATREEEVYLTFPGYSKYVSRTFESREEALKDKVVSDMICPQCRRMLKKKVRWFPVSQRLYYGLAICPEHGFIKGKIRIKKQDEGRVFAVKTMKPAGESAAEEICARRDEAKKKRSERNRAKRQAQKNRKQEA